MKGDVLSWSAVELLEREGALSRLDALFAEAASGQGALVFIGGEAGVGKSALVRRFVENVANDVRILTGFCDPLATPRPLGPLMDMAPDLSPDVSRLIGEDSSRIALFAAFLADVSDGARPTLLVFEDLHWGDDSTLDLVRFLGRRIGGIGCVALATYRDDEVGPRHRLKTVMGDLATAPGVHRVHLDPLSTAAVATLAGAAVNAADLHRRTGGNPFFVTEILSAGDAGIPGTLRDTILARAARLSPSARALLEAAAVIGLRAETVVLQAVADPADETVDECLSAGLLSSDPDALFFRHELARETILDAISSPRRIDLNARVLDELRRDPTTSLARLVQHAEGARDTDALLELAPAAAAQAASLRSHTEAAAQYARALRFGEKLAPETRATYLEAESYEYQLTDQLTLATAARQQACDLRQELGDMVRYGDDLQRLSWLLRFSGRYEEAESAATHAIDVLESQPPSRELAWAYSNESHLRMLDADGPGTLDWGQRAVEMGRRFGDVAVVSHALNNMGSARLTGGDEGGREQLLEALRLAQSVDAEEEVARAYVNLIAPYAWHWRADLLDELIPPGLAYCVEHDLDGIGLYIRAFAAFTELMHGHWDTAKDSALHVITRPNAAPASNMVALMVLGRARARRGDPDALRALDEALELGVPSGELLRHGPMSSARAEAYWLAGDPDSAAAAAEEAIDLAARQHHVGLYGELAYWRWRAGREQELPDEGPEGFRLEMLGQWRGAADVWTKLGCPYEAAQALSQSDDVSDVRQALLEFDRLGAKPAAALTTRRMRELGVKSLPRGPRPTTRANPAGLTNREVEVLAFLAEDLSNVQIAARLHLSPKTVDHHVSSILGKLGVRNRSQAARAVKDLLPAVSDR